MDNVTHPPAGEADEAPAVPASKRTWTKPRIKPLRVISTYTGTKTGSSDEDNATSPTDLQQNYTECERCNRLS